MVQVVECLSSKHNTLSSNPSTTKIQNKTKTTINKSLETYKQLGTGDSHL
jgi:hypothetical protein